MYRKPKATRLADLLWKYRIFIQPEYNFLRNKNLSFCFPFVPRTSSETLATINNRDKCSWLLATVSTFFVSYGNRIEESHTHISWQFNKFKRILLIYYVHTQKRWWLKSFHVCSICLGSLCVLYCTNNCVCFARAWIQSYIETLWGRRNLTQHISTIPASLDPLMMKISYTSSFVKVKYYKISHPWEKLLWVRY